MEENKAKTEAQFCGRRGAAILSKVVRKGLTDKVRHEQRLEGGEEERMTSGRRVLLAEEGPYTLALL